MEIPRYHPQVIWLVTVLLLLSCSSDHTVLFSDPLNGTVVNGWTISPNNIIHHPEYGDVYQLKGDSIWLKGQTPSIGEGKWSNYRVAFEVMITEKEGFVGLDYNLQDNPDESCNFHFSTFRDTLRLQSMGLWGVKKGSWKLWPVSQEAIPLTYHQWMKFELEVGNEIANVYVNGKCIYTIFDIPFSTGGIRFFTTYGGSAYFRNLEITKIQTSNIQPQLPDIWEASRTKNLIRKWQITNLKPATYTDSGIISTINLDNEKWIEVNTDARGVLNIGAIYPHYDKNTVLAKTYMNASVATTVTCFLTYTDKLTLFCNGEAVFTGPDRSWWNPDRAKHGNSRLIPDQYKVAIPLTKGKNEIIIRSEVMENFGWGIWMRTE